MGYLSSKIGRKAAELSYDQVANLIDGFSSSRIAGVSVTEKTALQVATVLACVRVIAEGVSTPDLHIYRQKPDGSRELATNIPEYRLLARRPNEWQTSLEWRKLMTIHAALTGTGLSIKVKGDNGRVRELIPVQPGQWSMRKVGRYQLVYSCYDEFGKIGDFSPDDVFLINGVQWDWASSLDAVALARSAVGLSIASERSQAAMHENGMKPAGVYSVTGTLKEEQHERLTNWIKKRYSGLSKAGDPLVLDNSATWTPLTQKSVDAQHLETRRMQVEEMCRAYGVFPIMVGHSDKTVAFASAEAFFGAHVKHTLTPWHKTWTQRMDEMLLDGSGPLFAGFDVRYLLAGAMRDRSQWSRTMVEMGIYTRNEVRDEEGKPPLPGLDVPLTPLNMTGNKTQGNDDETPPADA